MPVLLPNKLTVISKAEALSALHAGWVAHFGSAPKSDDSLRVLLAQWAFETGWGKAMHNYNFGNVKSVAGDGYDYCQFRCYEKIKGKTVWFDPPNPACRFRAFKTAAEGAADYLKILNKRFQLSWPAVLSGDPAKFSHALKQQHYYTDDETHYTYTLKSIFDSLKKEKVVKKPPPKPDPKKPPPPKPPPAGKPVVIKNVIDGIGASAAREGLTRSLSAHGFELDGGAKWTLTDPLQAADRFHAVKLLPGDAVTFVTATSPRHGRVATVLYGDSEYADHGTLWVASASGPNQEVMIEKLALEASPRDFDASEKEKGKPVEKWKANEARPSKGHAWIVGLIRTSQVQRGRVDKMSDGQRTKLKIKKGEAKVTPGTNVPRSAKQSAGDPTIHEVPMNEDPKVKEKAKTKNASGPGIDPPPLTSPANDEIPPAKQIDSHTVQIRIGNHAGRVGFAVRTPPVHKPTPSANPPAPPKPKADKKRDDFIHAAMNLVGTPFLAGSVDASKGLDGVGLISIALRRVGVMKKDDPALTVDTLNGMFEQHGGTAADVPDVILPGDLAWFGKGTHDVDAQQHPMIYLGGGKVLGPIADGGPKGGAVQVIKIADVPEHFAGWAHNQELGADTKHTAHPGEPKPGAIASPAVLPASPAQRYDALKAIAKDKKAPWNDAKGQVNLVGVKNMHEGALILPKEDDWNDTLFAVFLDDDGNKCAIEMRASLNPGSDKDPSGSWQLAEGGYKFKLGAGDGTSEKTLKPDGNIKGWFDEHGSGAPRAGDLKHAAGGEDSKPPATTTAAAGGDSGGDSPSDSTTEAPAATTTAPADSTTAAPEPTTTAAPEATTTAAPAATTTAPAASTTAAPAATTTEPAPATTAPPESTTEAPPASTTAAEATTTAPPATTTAPAATTTAPAATTTAAPATTAAPTTAAPTTAAPTTAAPAPSTTVAPAATTTAAPATTTTHPPATTTAASDPGKVTSSKITVGGKPFPDWFNEDFRPQYPGNHPTLLLWKKPAPMFPSKVNKANFGTVFDNVKYLWAPELTVPEFLGFFGIFYNETGGSMQPIGEVGNAKYMFEATPGGKASYNTGKMNRPAGDQLKARGIISDQADVDAWNSGTYPASAPQNVLDAAKECDFWKYRGHGFIQTTFHQNYVRDCNPALKAAGYNKTIDDMTSAELENAIKTDPKVSLPMVKSFFKNISGFKKVNDDPPVWFDTGRAVSGQKPYGDLYQWRLETIFAAMKKAGFQTK